MTSMVFPEDYRYLYEKNDPNKKETSFTKEEIVDRFADWMKRIDSLLFNMGLSDKTRIDSMLLSYAVLDYYADIKRIKNFHGMERVKVEKIYSYGLYWLLRTKPIQLLEEVDENCIYINEKVMLMCTFTMMFTELGIDLDSDCDDKAFNDYVLLFYYNMKYRTFTPKTIELALESIHFGMKGIYKESNPH